MLPKKDDVQNDLNYKVQNCECTIMKYMDIKVLDYTNRGVPQETLVCSGRELVLVTGAYPGFGRGGGQEFFFRFGNLHVAKRHDAHGEAIRMVRGVRGHAPPRNFFETVQFGAF